MTETYYTILGVDPTADQAAIRKAYLKLSLKHHPDKNPDNAEASKEIFVKIGQAYEVLSDPATRSAYDRELRSGGSSSGGGGFGFGNGSTGFTSSQPAKSYETYREAFDDHVGNMSEDELRAAMGAAAVIGGLVGSLLGSGLARKVAGNSAIGRAALETAGSLIGSTVGSEASVSLLQNVHTQSRERITYEERRRMAMMQGGPIPEKPKEGWGDLNDIVNRTVNDVKSQMNGEAQPVTARGQAFSGVFGAMKNAKKLMEMKEMAEKAAGTHRR